MTYFAILTRRVPAVERGGFVLERGAVRCPDGWLGFVAGPDGATAHDALLAYVMDGCMCATRNARSARRVVAMDFQ